MGHCERAVRSGHAGRAGNEPGVDAVPPRAGELRRGRVALVRGRGAPGGREGRGVSGVHAPMLHRHHRNPGSGARGGRRGALCDRLPPRPGGASQLGRRPGGHGSDTRHPRPAAARLRGGSGRVQHRRLGQVGAQVARRRGPPLRPDVNHHFCGDGVSQAGPQRVARRLHHSPGPRRRGVPHPPRHAARGDPCRLASRGRRGGGRAVEPDAPSCRSGRSAAHHRWVETLSQHRHRDVEQARRQRQPRRGRPDRPHHHHWGRGDAG
mmetsp:Transcript_22641/g.85787  ORF Transcript_22641/g.85787 Transcript_22641/m.85787 type:complete len:265 (+) Transcript_22641:415-1209(+)